MDSKFYTTPAETFKEVILFFGGQPRTQAIGIASFGPLDLNEQSPNYGIITTTPKDGWANTDIVGSIANELKVPVAIDTDVNCAALAEQFYGAAKGLRNLVYMTVGTGIGIGCIIDNRTVHGTTHTEMGHMLIPHNTGDSFSGSCPFHRDCLEGLASGTPLQQRTGIVANELNDDSVWNLEAHYLAMGIVNIITFAMPEVIIIGGGVMNHPGLLEQVRQQVPELINGYLKISELKDFIVSPHLGSLSGVSGALVLASQLAAS